MKLISYLLLPLVLTANTGLAFASSEIKINDNSEKQMQATFKQEKLIYVNPINLFKDCRASPQIRGRNNRKYMNATMDSIKTGQNQSLSFPERCLGTWVGMMKIYRHNALVDSVKVRFTSAITEKKGVYTWRTEYLSPTTPVTKNYQLKINDLSKGLYTLDEGDGLELPAYQINNKLYNLFKVGETWITATNEIRGDELIFEVASGKEIQEVKGIKNVSFVNLQRVILKKVR